MSDRIRSLEEALEAFQTACSSEPHPLLSPELLHIKSALALYGGTQTGSSHSPPPMATHESGQERMEVELRDPSPSAEPALQLCHSQVRAHRPASARATSLMSAAPRVQAPLKDEAQDEGRFSTEVLRLSHRFPMAQTISPDVNLSLRKYIRRQLPPRPEAAFLWEQARQNALWQCVAHPLSRSADLTRR